MREISTVIGGGTPDTQQPAYFGGEIAWVTPADLSNPQGKLVACGARSLTLSGYRHSGAQLMPQNSVLLSSRAPIGYVAIAANPICTNQGFKSFVLQPGVTPDFIYYYLQFAKRLVIGLASGTTFLEISGKKAGLIPVAIAPSAEQARITEAVDELFSDLDAGVAALERVRTKLKLYRAAVLKAASAEKITGLPGVPTIFAILAEMKGLAEGSQIPYDKILLLNLFPEMFH